MINTHILSLSLSLVHTHTHAHTWRPQIETEQRPESIINMGPGGVPIIKRGQKGIQLGKKNIDYGAKKKRLGCGGGRRMGGMSIMGWLRLVGSSKLYVSFAEYRLFYRALLQKRPIILRRLLIVATPYQRTKQNRNTIRKHKV